MKYKHSKLCFCNQEDSLHYKNKYEALSQSNELSNVGVRRKDKSAMLYNYNNKTPQMYKPTQNLMDPN